jgi:hypothetical protein
MSPNCRRFIPALFPSVDFVPLVNERLRLLDFPFGQSVDDANIPSPRKLSIRNSIVNQLEVKKKGFIPIGQLPAP